MKIDRKALQKDRERMTKNLKIIQKNFSAKVLAKVIGVSPKTWHNRINAPEKFTYGELKTISRFTGINFETITTGEVKLR